jgi:hypothetical protein
MNLEQKKQHHLKIISSHMSEEVIESLIEYVSLSVMEKQFSLNLDDYDEQSNIVSIDTEDEKDDTIAFHSKDEQSVA